MSYDMIRRDALLEFARNHIDGKIDANDIARFPYANAEPVRHGRWIKHGFADIWRCTKCGRYAGDNSAYCPNCGAKMNAEVEG